MSYGNHSDHSRGQRLDSVVTTVRTTGSVEPYADLHPLGQRIERGEPGPELDVATTRPR